MSLGPEVTLLPSGQTVYFGTGVPTANDLGKGQQFNVGDIVFNTGAVAGQTTAWQCTAAGLPGTWQDVDGGVEATAVFPTNASLITTSFYVTFAANYNVVAVTETHAVAATDAGAVTLQIYADASGGAQGSGTALLGTALSLKTTANTPQQGVLIAAPQLLATQRLTVVFTGTLTSLSGIVLKVYLQKLS